MKTEFKREPVELTVHGEMRDITLIILKTSPTLNPTLIKSKAHERRLVRESLLQENPTAINTQC